MEWIRPILIKETARSWCSLSLVSIPNGFDIMVSADGLADGKWTFIWLSSCNTSCDTVFTVCCKVVSKLMWSGHCQGLGTAIVLINCKIKIELENKFDLDTMNIISNHYFGWMTSQMGGRARIFTVIRFFSVLLI